MKRKVKLQKFDPHCSQFSNKEQSCEKSGERTKESRQRNFTVPILTVITASYGYGLLDQH
jgi:hypothetical protein